MSVLSLVMYFIFSLSISDFSNKAIPRTYQSPLVCTLKMKCWVIKWITSFILFSLTVLICLKNGEFVISFSGMFDSNLNISNVLGVISVKIGIYCRETLFQHNAAYF